MDPVSWHGMKNGGVIIYSEGEDTAISLIKYLMVYYFIEEYLLAIKFIFYGKRTRQKKRGEKTKKWSKEIAKKNPAMTESSRDFILGIFYFAIIFSISIYRSIFGRFAMASALA